MPPYGQGQFSVPIVEKFENIHNTPLPVSITGHIRTIADMGFHSDFNGYCGSQLLRYFVKG